MCGIFGIVYSEKEREVDCGRLHQSAVLLSHRGPDGTGIYRERGVGLAHTRLSLLDLNERSNQPFWDQERRFCIVFNGEIYNFRELKRDLEARGIRFQTTSDTEVLLYALITDGAEATVRRLQGMFAFALFDKKTNSLLLSRDRFGIKPLVVYQDSEKFMFASECKAFQPWCNLAPNGFQMIRYLMHFGQPVRGSCFFENVSIVPPGSLIRLKVGCAPEYSEGADIAKMFRREKTAELDRLSDDEAVDLLDAQLSSSVENMLFADAPVGALCSGGVDSSVLMAMAAKRHNNLAIFHANVVGPLSEFDAARELARHLKLELIAVEVHDRDFIDATADALYHYEQPFSHHPHSIPFLMVSRLVQKSGVKAVLTGEGSDECFLGYGRLALRPLWDFYRRQAGRVAGLLRRVPVIGEELSPRKDQVGTLIGQMLGQFENEWQRRHIHASFAEKIGRQPDRNIQTVEQLSYHLRTLLHRNDTMGMTASIEARFPFLDEGVVESAINLPYRHKIRWQADVWDRSHPFVRDKWILRRVADRYLPKELSHRKKLGFPVSAYRRMRIDAAFYYDSFLADYFKLTRASVDFLLEGADQQLKNRLMLMDAWGQIYFCGQSRDAVRAKLHAHASF